MQKSDVGRGKNQSFTICAARGLFVSVAVILVLFAAFAALVSSGRAPEAAMGAMTWIAAFLSSFAGSAIAVKSHRPRALAMGLSVAGALFALTLLGAAFSEEGGLMGHMTMSVFLALMAGGVLASFISPRKKKQQRSRKR